MKIASAGADLRGFYVFGPESFGGDQGKRNEPEIFCRQNGVSGGAVSLWINGKREPELADIERMTVVLGVSLSYLVGSKPDSQTAPVGVDSANSGNIPNGIKEKAPHKAGLR